MILELAIENTLSIASRVVINFGLQELFPYAINVGNRFISRIKCIYGDNGSGKTNLIQAINFYFDFILNSFTQLQPNESTHFIPFQFNEQTRKLPGVFSIIFFIDSVKYDYELVLNKDNVLKESLFFVPNGQKTLLFSRNDENIKWGTCFLGAKRLLANTTRKNCSLISVAAQLNNQTLLPIYSFMRKYFKGIVSPEKEGLGYALSLVEENKIFKEKIISLLREMHNSNISDIKVESKPIPLEYLNSLPQEIRIKILKHNSMPKNRKAIFIHSYDNDYSLPLESESRGTQRLLELAAPLFELVQTQSFLMIDELETSLHPKIQKYLISQFLENKTESQLLITTHNIDLMNSGLFNDSEICFAIKDPNGNTVLHSISDFTGVRKGVSRKYLYESGKFNCLPPKVKK
jgi:putative ATP-binding protein